MLTLVYKDFIVQRAVILVYLVGAVLFTTGVISVNAPVVVAAMLAMTFPFASAAQGDRANSHLLLNSLPVTRREIVTAKYVFHVAASLCFVGVAAAADAAFGGLPLRTALSQVLIATNVVAWFLAVFFPMYYGLGPRFVQIGMIAFFVALMTVAPMVYNLGVKRNFWGLLEFTRSLPAASLHLLLTAVTLVVLVGSWLTSVWLYSRKKL